MAVGIRLLAQHHQIACKTSQHASVLAKEGRFLGQKHTPAEFQTLIVWSYDPDTILVPSGENATDVIPWLCAFVFSLSSPSLPARQANRHQFWSRGGDFESSGTPESQTLIILSYDPDKIFDPSGENATDMT